MSSLFKRANAFKTFNEEVQENLTKPNEKVKEYLLQRKEELEKIEKNYEIEDIKAKEIDISRFPKVRPIDYSIKIAFNKGQLCEIDKLLNLIK